MNLSDQESEERDEVPDVSVHIKSIFYACIKRKMRVNSFFEDVNFEHVVKLFKNISLK